MDIHRNGISLQVFNSIYHIANKLDLELNTTREIPNLKAAFAVYYVQHIYVIYQVQHLQYIMFLYFGMSCIKLLGKGLHTSLIWK